MSPDMDPRMSPDDVRLWRDLVAHLSREDLARLRTEPDTEEPS